MKVWIIHMLYVHYFEYIRSNFTYNLKVCYCCVQTSPGCLPKFKGCSEYCPGSGGKGYSSDRSNTSISPTHTKVSSSIFPKAYGSFFSNSLTHNKIKYSSSKGIYFCLFSYFGIFFTYQKVKIIVCVSYIMFT